MQILKQEIKGQQMLKQKIKRLESQRLEGQKGLESKWGGPRPAGSGSKLEDK